MAVIFHFGFVLYPHRAIGQNLTCSFQLRNDVMERGQLGSHQACPLWLIQEAKA
jgi:hypothetical protein